MNRSRLHRRNRVVASLAVAGALSLLPLGCAGQRREPVRTAVMPEASLPSDDATLRTIAGILRAEDRRVSDDALRAGLVDAVPSVRALAVRAAGRMNEASLRPAIEDALSDEDASVRASAAGALALIADPASVPALVEASRDRRPAVRAAAIRALGRTGAAAGLPSIADGLSDDASEARSASCDAAWRVPDATSLVDRLIASFDEGDRDVRRACAYALGRLGAAGTAWTSSGQAVAAIAPADRLRVRDALGSAILDGDAEVRMQVARGLTEPDRPFELSVLLALARDSHPGVRVNAVRALSYPSAPIEPAISRALVDAWPAVIQAAVEALGRIRSPAAAQQLFQGLPKEKRPWMLATAIKAVAGGYPDELPAIASRYYAHEAPSVRAAVALALAGRPEPEARDLARSMLADPDPAVRGAAVAAVGTHGGKLSASLAAVRDDPDVVVRGAVARAAAGRLDVEPVGSLERVDALGLFDSLWERARGDEDPAARTEAIVGLGAAGDVPGVVERLRRGLDDPDYRVRLAAVRSLREVFGEDHRDRLGPASERPVEHYLEILRWARSPREALITVEREGTTGGFRVLLDPVGAPLASWNFRSLADEGFYDGLVVHRVVPNFVVQDGDPRGDGEGGPSWSIRDEVDALRFDAGVLGMASSGPDTAGSQWFVTLSSQPHLDGRYTAFGTVTEGFETTVWSIQEGDRVVSVRVR